MTNNQPPEGSNVDSHWHMDKRVPIAIVFAIVLQTIYFTIFLTKLDGRVAGLEKESMDIHKTISDMAEVKIRQEYIARKLDRIDNFLRDDVEWVRPKKYKGK